MVDVVVTQVGYAGKKVPLIVEDEGRIVSTQDVTLPGDGESQTVKVRFKASDVGPAHVQFRDCAAGQRGSHAEQPARRADRGLSTGARRFCTSRASRGPSRSSSGRRRTRTTTCRSCCCSARPRRRSTRAGQVPAAGRRRPRGAARAASRPHAKSCSRIAAIILGSDRGVGVHARPAADARGLRGRARRRPAGARRRRDRSPKAAGPARRLATRCRSCSIADRAARSIRRPSSSCGRRARAPAHPSTQITDTGRRRGGEVARPAAADVAQSAARERSPAPTCC